MYIHIYKYISTYNYVFLCIYRVDIAQGKVSEEEQVYKSWIPKLENKVKILMEKLDMNPPSPLILSEKNTLEKDISAPSSSSLKFDNGK
jgi:hypothetical protein